MALKCQLRTCDVSSILLKYDASVQSIYYTKNVKIRIPVIDRQRLSKPASPQPSRDAIRDALRQWKNQGIPDWEILDTWAKLAQQQGNYAVADTLQTAAYELGKPLD
jgi:hypothetical protein